MLMMDFAGLLWQPGSPFMMRFLEAYYGKKV